MKRNLQSRRKFLSSIGKSVAGAGLLSSAGAAPLSPVIARVMASESYSGPIEGYSLPGRTFDSLDFCHKLYNSIPRKLAFKAGTMDKAMEWQEELRGKLIELMGGFPAEKSPLNAQVLEKREFPEYVREKVVFQSRPELSVFGYFLKPHNYSAPGPCMICLPGHGRGVDDIVGITEDGEYRSDRSGYMHDFALQAVDHGFAALAIEQLAFGCRRDHTARSKGMGSSSCQPASGAALMFGYTMVGWRVYDVIRSVDYLETRSEIDANRIGVMGISGGGTITFFSVAAEPRLKAGFSSGYFNLFRDSVMSIPHCMDNYVPGILNYAEMYDIAGLIPPRAFFAESGTRDTIFPVEATREAFSKAQEIFRFFNNEDKIGMEIFEDEHTFYGKEGFKFLKKWL